MASDQVSTSNNFASRGQDKFANAQYSLGLGNAPIFDHHAAQFECKTWAVYEGGDHMIIVGEVIKYRSNDSVEPLVFSRGSYAVAAQHPEMVKSSTPDSNDNDADFVNDYLLYLLREAYQRFSANLYPKLNKQCNVTPEEWRILARMVNASSIEISKLTDMVMQPDLNLRETADRMVTKGLIEYQDKDTLKVTVIGQTIAKEMKEIALREEKALLDELDSGQAKLLKDTLKSIIN